jgi:hypothetical protein
MKPETKAKLENLFDNDTTNSNNIFDRIQDQMTSPAVDKKIDSIIDDIGLSKTSDEQKPE